MADITKCMGKGCEKAINCYRKQVKSNAHHQSYFMKEPIKPDGSCDEFWPFKNEEMEYDR